jgi:hypothetical protein
MGGEVVGNSLGEGDRALRCCCLGFGFGDNAPDFGERAGDGDAAPGQIEILGLEGGEFPEPCPGVASCEDKGSVAGIDDVGNVVEFLHAQEPLLGLDASREIHPRAGCSLDEGVVDRGVELHRHQPVGELDGCRRITLLGEFTDPILDVVTGDVTEPPGTEAGEDERAEVRFVSFSGGVADVEPGSHPPVAPFRNGDAAGVRVDPVTAVD